jgi:hypothetical protein
MRMIRVPYEPTIGDGFALFPSGFVWCVRGMAQAMDPDACSEIAIMDTGLQPGMQLSEPVRITALGDDSQHSVSRTVTWAAYDADGNTTDESAFDMRDQYSVTCFYATDQYLLTAYPYHCVQVSYSDSLTPSPSPEPSSSMHQYSVTCFYATDQYLLRLHSAFSCRGRKKGELRLHSVQSKHHLGTPVRSLYAHLSPLSFSLTLR